MLALRAAALGIRRAATASAARFQVLPSQHDGDCTARWNACVMPRRRYASSGGAGWPSDRIHIRGMLCYGRHGVFVEEQRLGQKFLVDVELAVDLERAGSTDDLSLTVDYSRVCEQVRSVLEGPPRQLIETVATEIADSVLREHKLVQGVRVAIQKPHVAVPHVLESLGVEITRSR